MVGLSKAKRKNLLELEGIREEPCPLLLTAQHVYHVHANSVVSHYECAYRTIHFAYLVNDCRTVHYGEARTAKILNLKTIEA
jgi:hypothetical protein